MNTIPRDKRACIYKPCICEADSLWPEPDYKPGELWMLYGSVYADRYEVVQILSTKQVLLLVKLETDYRQHHALMDVQKNGYATDGKLELRVKIENIEKIKRFEAAGARKDAVHATRMTREARLARTLWM